MSDREIPMDDARKKISATGLIGELRVEPVQQRAHSRLADIEAAARLVLAESGRDRFNTQKVAETAGCSIGTLYRYFPDRVALLDRIWPDRDDSVTVAAMALSELLPGSIATVHGVVRRMEAVFDDGLSASFVDGVEVTVFCPY